MDSFYLELCDPTFLAPTNCGSFLAIGWSDYSNDLCLMQKLDNTDAHPIIPFSSSCGISSIATLAFTAVSMALHCPYNSM